MCACLLNPADLGNIPSGASAQIKINLFFKQQANVFTAFLHKSEKHPVGIHRTSCMLGSTSHSPLCCCLWTVWKSCWQMPSTRTSTWRGWSCSRSKTWWSACTSAPTSRESTSSSRGSLGTICSSWQVGPVGFDRLASDSGRMQTSRGCRRTRRIH